MTAFLLRQYLVCGGNSIFAFERHPALISPAPHYGLRYGFAPATGDFFHGGNTGSNPVGDAKPFQQLTVSPPPFIGTKKEQFSASTRMHFIEAAVFSHRSRHFEQAQIRNTSQQTGLNQQPL